jgi:acyl-CoA synthetase
MTTTLASIVAAHAVERPGDAAYITRSGRMTWREYHERSDALAAALLADGLQPSERVAVVLPDGDSVHVAFLAIEKAGGVIVGIGARAGEREREHLLAKTGARRVIDGAELTAPRRGSPDPDRARERDDLWLLNSTSGTTGLPKVVMHDQARWFAFHDLAVAAGALTSADVFMSALPAPFGFGIWTAHVTPTLLGAPCVVMPRFDPDACLELVERERVSVLAAVSTQFVMMLEAHSLATRDLSSLRVLFTGGEMVPYERAAQFEDRTGCTVLQFYGSNETGALSRTTLADDREHRLRTAGRVLREMHVRLLSDDGRDITATGGPGIAACKGPVNCLGYLDDDEANAQLFTDDGWMLTGDYCTIDADEYLTVAGRASDFIIRGGKNVSAAQVEDEVATHPSVALAAAVAMPDPTFGERVCVYVEQRPGTPVLTLDDLREHLGVRGVGKELWPERIEIVDALPRSSGGKVAKGELRADIRRRLGKA